MAVKKKSKIPKVEASKKKKVTVAKGVKIPRGKEAKLEKKPGGSNTGEYKTVNPKDFAGKSGGTSPFSFPINTLARARNALARAHFAPNPEGIKRAVYKKFPALKKRSEQANTQKVKPKKESSRAKKSK